MDTTSTISNSKVSDCENSVQSNFVDVELFGNRCEAVDSENADPSKDLSEDQLYRLLGKVPDSELQEIATFVNGNSVGDQVGTPDHVLFTLLKVKRILHLQLLLFIVGRRDIALLMTYFAQRHRLVHLHQVTNCVFTIVVVDDISDATKQEFVTIVRSWMPEAKIVLTKLVCHTWLRKDALIGQCKRCLQHLGFINSILNEYIRQRGIYLLHRLNTTSEISVEICDAGCEKCYTIDDDLGLLIAVREALKEFNTLKRNIKQSKEKQIPHRVAPHSDANAKGKRTIHDFRSGVQRIVSPYCGPKCLT